MLQYQKNLNQKRDASDPWRELANAIIEQAADDYRRSMTKKIKLGLKLSDLEMPIINSRINECKQFFESGWGYFLSRGLAPVIWERLQAEFKDELAELEEELARRKEEKHDQR